MLLTITLLTPSSRTADIFNTAREPPAHVSADRNTPHDRYQRNRRTPFSHCSTPFCDRGPLPALPDAHALTRPARGAPGGHHPGTPLRPDPGDRLRRQRRPDGACPGLRACGGRVGGVRLRPVLHDLGLDELLQLRLLLRHRRLGRAVGSRGPDGGHHHDDHGHPRALRGLRARMAAALRQHSGRVRGHEGLTGRAVAAGRAGQPGPGPRLPDPRPVDRTGPGAVGRHALRPPQRPVALHRLGPAVHHGVGGADAPRAPLRPHGLAPSSPGRALRPVDDHHPGRGAGGNRAVRNRSVQRARLVGLHGRGPGLRGLDRAGPVVGLLRGALRPDPPRAPRPGP